jgi:hypothetical protein
MKKLIVFASLLIFFAACDRDFDFDVISETEPALVVVAETVTGSGKSAVYTKVSGATVNLYNNQADFNASTAPYKTKTSGTDGKAIFTQTDLAQKGVFYVRVISGSKTGSVTTPYILLNDGETTVFVALN